MAAEKKQITRSRISYSCQTCRRRKVKCDKQHPVCGGCQKADEKCVYGEPAPETTGVNSDDSRKRRAPDASDSSQIQPSVAIKALEIKLDHLAKLIHDFSKENGSANGESSETPSQSTTPTNFVEYAHTASDYPSSSKSTLFSVDNSNITVNSTAHDPSLLDALTKLDQLNTLFRLGIDAHRKHSQPVPRPQASLRQVRADDTMKDSRNRSGTNNFNDETVVSSFGANEDIMAPTGADSNVLFRSWLFTTYPVYPLFSPKLVLQKYQDFQNWYCNGMDKGEPNPDSSFNPFLNLIWYMGFCNLSPRAQEKWFPYNSAWQRRLRERLEYQLEAAKHEANPSMWSLGASIISQNLALGGQNIMAGSIRNTFNVRTAQSHGLHSEKPLKNLDEKDAETRRRLWWEVVSADATLSTLSGMPVMIDEMYTDTSMISELKEAIMGTIDAAEYEKHLQEPQTGPDSPDDPFNNQTSSVVSAFHLVAKARHQLTVGLKKVLKVNMSARPMTADELKEMRKCLMQIRSEVTALVNRIPTRGVPELDFTPELTSLGEFDHMENMGSPLSEHEISYFLRETSDQHGLGGTTLYHRTATIAFHKWARIMLSMMVDRIDCISYSPFLKNSKSRVWAVARSCALKGCHGYMRKFLSLAEDPELRMFRWTWSTAFHPLHATIILLIDVHDRPHSEEAPRSRAMIDKMLSLSDSEKERSQKQDNGRLVMPLKEGGDEAWTMLLKLRHKAWQRAGLDPDVLWSEEDQIAVGVGKPLSENDLFIRSLREDIIFSHKQRQCRQKQAEQLSALPLLRGIAGVRVVHPYELGPGEQVSGPVTRNIDLDKPSEVPQILLLRARSDQELMPFSTSEASESTTHPSDEQHTKTPAQQMEEPDAEIFHIGELIKKIRQSQKNATKTERPTLSSHFALQTQPLSEYSLPERRNCDFLTTRAVENAAYQDLLDRNTTLDMPLMSSNTSKTSQSGIEHGPRFRIFPVPPAPTFDTTGTNNKHISDRTAILRQQSLKGPDTTDSVAFAASIPPTLHNHGYTWSKAPLWVDGPDSLEMATQETQAQIETMTMRAENYTTIVPETTNVEMSSDIEFDWDKWDELFGSFTGLGDDMWVEGHDLNEIL